ncbi:MAG: glycosyltransferase, partial [Akkermansiaceae bacterium]|nr:glycosyltransferase [Akkermansiaceae bacterium]
ARRLGPVLWGKNLRGQLEEFAPEVIHTHGLWGQPSIVGSRLKSPGLAKVISPHGMLDSWALQNGRLKKQLAMKLFERRFLASADCLHALCRSEADSIRALGFQNPIAVIPNGVDLPESREAKPQNDHRRTLLFLGRLHPKKGLPNALRAFAQFLERAREVPDENSWRFVIAGWDQGGHGEELKELCRELGLPFSSIPAAELVANHSRDPGPDSDPSPRVVFVGSAFGETKDELLRLADIFILPSFSEGLPVAVLEAWAYGLPVLMTDHCNLPEGFEAEAAVRIGTDVESIAQGMVNLLRSPHSNLRSIGENGRALVERQFTWPQIAAQMEELYQWILNSEPKPDFVELSEAHLNLI